MKKARRFIKTLCLKYFVIFFRILFGLLQDGKNLNAIYSMPEKSSILHILKMSNANRSIPE